MLVIDPDQCIDCGVCEPEWIDAIEADAEACIEHCIEINAAFSKAWPNINSKKPPRAEARDWEGIAAKREYFSTKPAAGP